MTKNMSLTRAEALKKAELFEELFTVVRILDAQSMDDIKNGIKPTGMHQSCPCFSIWNRNEHCKNCISLRAFQENREISKFEFKDNDVYYVIAQSLIIDGEPAVIEYVKHLQNDPFIDDAGRNRFIEKLFNFENLLYTDALTGIYNRRYYEDKVRLSREPVGVAMMDIDRFKYYNDQFGHAVGDLVLKTVANEIKRVLDPRDRLIRFGGDEFLLLTANTDPDFLSGKLAHIRKHFNEVRVPDYPQLRISISIGGVICKDETLEEAVERADCLMYYAKNGKKSLDAKDAPKFIAAEDFLDGPKHKAKPKVLIVDDAPLNREILTEILQPHFQILEAANGEEALQLLHAHGTGISLILLDMIMPVMDGLGVLSEMKAKHWTEDIPVIVISEDAADANITEAFEMGISDYILRPFHAKVVLHRVLSTIKTNAKQQALFAMVSKQIYEKDRDQKMMAVILSHIVEFHNGESRLHILRINVLTEILLKKLVTKTDRYHLTRDEMNQIAIASSLHDIGKIAIPSEIINKPGKLSAEEFEIVKRHTLLGEEMLKSVYRYKDEPLVKLSEQICRWHHERYDGNGYPDGLKGEDIPIAAQVVALADAYDALVSKRAYKESLSQAEAFDMLQRGGCGAFQPLLLECLIESKDEIQRKYDETIDADYIL